jgi:hypothetical protein
LATFRPQQIGDVPVGLAPYHREFLRKLKDAIGILWGDVQSQFDSEQPGSQAVTFDDLEDYATKSYAEEQALLWSLIFRRR